VRWLQKNFKVIAIAESFKLEDGFAVYAGVLARRDGLVEKAAYELATLGGTDGTEKALRIARALNRPDVHMVMLGGCIVSYYNWIDGETIWRELGLPTACYLFEKPEGDVRAALEKLFPDWRERWENISRLGPSVEFAYPDGPKVYVRSWGLDPRDAYRAALLSRRYGKIPEPLRIAKTIAEAARVFLEKYRGKTTPVIL
jgi:endonuclease V-like protein UPF0215 family